MNILLLGSGGREHAIAWKLRQSPRCTQLFIAPGNPGTASLGENLAFGVNDFDAITNCCKEKSIDIVVVGPEDPLVNGIYDHLRKNRDLDNMIIVGPSAEAAQLEGSKAFAKAFMGRHGIPTAAYKEFTKDNYAEGLSYLHQHALPIVLKADGLAAGKGVVIAQTHKEALETFADMIQEARFGAASAKVVVEQFLSGVELSVFALTNGREFVVLPEAKDYKRIGEGDTGPNTGGMGAISPVPFAKGEFMEKVMERIIKPTIDGLNKEGLTYFGFVFFGLINVGGDPYVIEYNCRMGDPETEVVMPRLASDLIVLFQNMFRGSLSGTPVEMDPRPAATVVLVSGGYPGDFDKGKQISGINQPFSQNTIPFFAGIKEEGGRLLTNGGRVAAVTSYGTSISEAVTESLAAIEKIGFENMNFRKDIGYEFNDR